MPPPFPVSGIRILLEAPYGNVLPTVRVVQVNSDWSFKLGSPGGKFLFRVTGLPDDWTLAAVRLDDKDISDVPYNVPTGGREISGMQMVLTRKIGRVIGPSWTMPDGRRQAAPWWSSRRTPVTGSHTHAT